MSSRLKTSDNQDWENRWELGPGQRFRVDGMRYLTIGAIGAGVYFTLSKVGLIQKVSDNLPDMNRTMSASVIVGVATMVTEGIRDYFGWAPIWIKSA